MGYGFKDLEYSDAFLRNTDGTTGAAIHERFEDYTYDYLGRRVSEIGSKVVAGLTQQRHSGDWTGYLGQEVVAKANATSGWTDGTRRWSGYFEVPSDGLYTFTGTGTNALLKIEVDGKGIGTAWVAGPTGTAEGVNVQFIVSTEAKVWWAIAWPGRTTGGARETDREMIELRPLIIEESRSLTTDGHGWTLMETSRRVRDLAVSSGFRWCTQRDRPGRECKRGSGLIYQCFGLADHEY